MIYESIDGAWFVQQLTRKGKSQADLARFLKLDRSAVTRILNGQRNMSVEEQDQIAEYLDVPVDEVAAHRRGKGSGFSEGGQSVYAGPLRSADMTTQPSMSGKKGRHPVFGCMSGTMTVPSNLDLTASLDVEWSEKLYNE